MFRRILRTMRGAFRSRRFFIALAAIAGFSAWYAFGFWGVLHRGHADSGASYAARKAAVQGLRVDPTALYPVVRVVDGDTFMTKIDGREVSVRVLGENAPETVKPKSPVECYGPEASERDKELLTGRSVRLEVDPAEDKVDFYGRLLAYVWRDDGLFLEEYMIKNGFAREYTFDAKRPYRYQKEFRADEAEAKAGRAGLWGRCQ